MRSQFGSPFFYLTGSHCGRTGVVSGGTCGSNHLRAGDTVASSRGIYSSILHNCSIRRRGNCSSDRRGKLNRRRRLMGARRRAMSEHELEGLSLPWRPLVRKNESRRVYVRVSSRARHRFINCLAGSHSERDGVSANPRQHAGKSATSQLTNE